MHWTFALSLSPSFHAQPPKRIASTGLHVSQVACSCFPSQRDPFSIRGVLQEWLGGFREGDDGGEQAGEVVDSFDRVSWPRDYPNSPRRFLFS